MSPDSITKGLAGASFSADDICRLLRACQKSGVRSIRWETWGIAEVTFLALPCAAQDTPIEQLGSSVPADPSQADEITRQGTEDEELKSKEAALDELMIQDPAEYERQVVDGSLIDEPREDAADDL